MHPGKDNFISSSDQDNTVRLWDTNTPNMCGHLKLHQPSLVAFDPSGTVIAVASEAAQSILLYDFRQYDKEPFLAFDMLEHAHEITPNSMSRGWNKLEFSNNGQYILVGTSGHGHYLLDAFDGSMKYYLERSKGGSRSDADAPTTIGDACFSPDGRYILSGQSRSNVLVWDLKNEKELPVTNKRLRSLYELEQKSEAAVIAMNPRYNMFASGDKEIVLWLPDQHA
jgi:COMPASS component SWD2